MSGSSYNEKLYTNVCSEKTLQSDKNGFFLQFCDHVAMTVGGDWANDTFAKLNSDRDRIRTVFTDPKIKDVVCGTLRNVDCVYRKKDASLSRDKRLDGDMFLKNGKTSKALIFYCQSVLRAPAKGVDLMVDAGRSLSLALWSRSRALMELGHLAQALADIQLALKEGLPDKFKAELYLRMALCYQGQAEHARAKVALALAAKLYGNNAPQIERAKAELKVAHQVRTKFKRVMPEIQEQHPDFEHASNLMKLERSEKCGRHMVARDHISTGTTLVVEPPYAACLLPECFGTHCHHCFQRLTAPIGCTECSGVAFCSVDCRDKALSTYHKYECRLLDLLIGSGMSVLCHLALRMVTQLGLDKCLDTYKRKDHEPVYQLCTNAERREVKDFLQRTLMAAFLLRCLQVCGFFPDRKDNDKHIILSEKEVIVGEILLLHLQILQFNAHELYETKCRKDHLFRGSKTGFIAVGVYPVVALCNHECYPAVMRYFVGRNIVITSSRPLKPGEVIAENYGPVFLRRNLEQRQRSLTSRYWFKCECRPCKENWKETDNVVRYKCTNENCDNLFTDASGENVLCPKCNQNISLKKSKDIVEKCNNVYKDCLRVVETQIVDNFVPMLKTSIDDFHRVAVPPHHDTHIAQETLRSILALSGNAYDCLVAT